MSRLSALVPSSTRVKALLRLTRFVVVSPFLLGRFGGPSSSLSAEITAPPKSPAPTEAPAIISEPAYGGRIEPGSIRGMENGTGRTPCNRKGSTRDWYKAITPSGAQPLDMFVESGAWGGSHDGIMDQPLSLSARKSGPVKPLASRIARGVPIA
jgi:hypothetical protein